MKPPKVSILMNCYNGAEYLTQALGSIKNQTYDNWEIVFIDNCSTDGSDQIAKDFGSKLKYYKTPEHYTLYEGRKFGLQFVDGIYLGFLDTDDFWEKDKLKTQVDLMEERKLDFTWGGVKVLLNSEQRTIYKSVVKPGPIDMNHVLRRYNINIQSVLLRVSKIGDLNFEKKLNISGDYLFFLKFLYKNQKAFYIDKPLVTYRIHDNNISKSKLDVWQKEKELICNELLPLFDGKQKRYLQSFWDKRIYRLHLKENEFKKARNMISPHKFLGLREFVMYVLTFTPKFKSIVVPSWWQ